MKIEIDYNGAFAVCNINQGDRSMIAQNERITRPVPLIAPLIDQ